jgi:hypothetical protein
MAALGVALCAVVWPHGTAAETTFCHPTGTRLEARSSKIEVYLRPSGSFDEIWACDRSTGQDYRFGFGEIYKHGAIAARGFFVAYAAFYEESQINSTLITVTDVRSDRPTMIVSAEGHVARIALLDAQRLAWAVCSPGTYPGIGRCRRRGNFRTTVAIYKHDLESQPKPGALWDTADLLDYGKRLHLHSFTLRDDVVSWRKGTRTKRHTLR